MYFTVMLWWVISGLFHQPHGWVSAFMPFGSFMKKDESGSSEWLADVLRQEEGWGAVFFLCLFKDTSLPYVRAAQGSFILKHKTQSWSQIINVMLKGWVQWLYFWDGRPQPGQVVVFHLRKPDGWWVCDRDAEDDIMLPPCSAGLKQMVLNSSTNSKLESPHTFCCSPGRAASVS